MSYPHRFYAITTPGLEAVAAKELEEFSAHEILIDNGGVHFSGTMETMFRVNLRSRSVTRVLLRLKRFTALSLHDIRLKVQQVEWQDYLNPACDLRVHVSCQSSRLMHTGKIESEIVEAIKSRGFTVEMGRPLQQVYIRIDNNRCLLSIDSSGERLDRRGYRLEGGKAPVRETLAAGVLQWMQWQPDEPLMVPMCGSGTFAIEAAMAALKRAPGLGHEFAFLAWPQLKQKSWRRVLERTQAMLGDLAGPLPIYASDINADAVEMASRNAERAGVAGLIHIEQKNVKELTRPDGVRPGLLICNPPYGQRIDTNVQALYAALGKLRQREFADWKMAVFSPERACEKALGLPVVRRLKIKHGGTWMYVLHV